MDKRKFAKMIRNEFPSANLEYSRFITHGWDHYVLKTKDKKIFRIPKDDRYKHKFINEIRLLKYLRNKVRVGIPHYKYISRSADFAGYHLLAGKELSLNTFRNLSRKDREFIAGKLGRFLTKLHSIPVNELNNFCIETVDNNKEFKELEKRIKKILEKMLKPEENELIRSYLDELYDSFEQSYEKVLVHNDLSGEHILWDKSNQQINIIDFSDRSIGDPAIDFTGFYEFDDEFPEMVYERYKGKKDNSMLSRAKLYFKRVPLYIMMDATEGFPCTFEEGYKMFNKAFK